MKEGKTNYKKPELITKSNPSVNYAASTCPHYIGSCADQLGNYAASTCPRGADWCSDKLGSYAASTCPRGADWCSDQLGNYATTSCTRWSDDDSCSDDLKITS